MAYKSILTDGVNFTKGCKTCPFWANGTNNRDYGCAIPAPIMECQYFREMYEKDAMQSRVGS